MELQYKLIRSSRRTLALEVTSDGEILVRAPLRTSEQRIADFVEQHREWIERASEKQRTRRENHPEPTAEQWEQYKKKANDWLPPRVAHFAALMGVTPTGIRVTGARKRFGSCSPKNSLCFSLFLMGYPDEAIDYVIVHELSHILHHDHSKQFWATVARYMPDYKRRRALLKQ